LGKIEPLRDREKWAEIGEKMTLSFGCLGLEMKMRRQLVADERILVQFDAIEGNFSQI